MSRNHKLENVFQMLTNAPLVMGIVSTSVPTLKAPGSVAVMLATGCRVMGKAVQVRNAYIAACGHWKNTRQNKKIWGLHDL